MPAMANTQMDPARSPEAKPLNQLEISFSGADAAVLAAELPGLPVLLPAGGKYFLRREGSALHVFETTQGISSFELSDPTATAGTAATAEAITLTLKSHPSFKQIVLHTAKADNDPNAVPASSAPVLPLIEEYRRLREKQYTPENSAEREADMQRMIDLIEKIREAYKPAAPSTDTSAETEAKAAERDKRKAAVKQRIKKAKSAPAATKPTRE